MTTYPEIAKIERFLILNFIEVSDLIGKDGERVLSLFGDIRKEIDGGLIQNKHVVATDNMDTNWIFEIESEKDGIYYLQFVSTAK